MRSKYQLKMESDNQEVLDYFKEIKNFNKLPFKTQEKIVLFFQEKRHYMVDPSDVKSFLYSGKKFTVVATLRNVQKFCENIKLKGLLVCKRVYPSLKWLEKRANILHSFCTDDTVLIFLTHCIELPNDKADEWYIISH